MALKAQATNKAHEDCTKSGLENGQPPNKAYLELQRKVAKLEAQNKK